MQSVNNVRHLQSQLLIELVDGIYAVETVGAPLEGFLDTSVEGVRGKWLQGR